MTDLSPQPAPKSSRRLRIALAVSVALNLAVLGVVAGAVLRDGPGFRGAAVRDLGFGPFAEALLPQDRHALRQVLFDRAPDMRAARREMRAEMGTILALLRADPVDVAALRALMAGQHDRLTGQLRLGQEVLVDYLAAMPAPERRAFADRLEDGLKHGGKDRKDHD